MSRLLVFLGYRTNRWLEHANAVAASSLGLNRTRILVDITNFTFPALWDGTSVAAPNFDEVIQGRKQNKSPPLLQPIGSDSLSAALSLLKNPSPKFFDRLVRTKMERRALGLPHFLEQLRCSSDDIVVVPNGRLFHEILLARWASKENLSTYFFEDGYLSDSTYLARFRPQDIQSHHNAFFDWQRHEGGKSFNVEKWLRERGASQSQEQVSTSKPYVTFLSSSTDEFLSLPQDWRTSQWLSQYSFLYDLCQEASKENLVVKARIHPNLLSKSTAQLMREWRELKHLRKKLHNLEVIPPHSRCSSYQLCHSAVANFTTLSTIGLECAALGYKIFLSTPSLYSSPMGLPVLSNQNDLKAKFRDTYPLQGSQLRAAAQEYLTFLTVLTVRKPVMKFTFSLPYLLRQFLRSFLFFPDLVALSFLTSRRPFNSVISRLVKW